MTYIIKKLRNKTNNSNLSLWMNTNGSQDFNRSKVHLNNNNRSNFLENLNWYNQKINKVY